MLPFLGQGACCALEDAVALGAALRDSEDPRAALRAYERDRAPRARRLVDGSRATARIALASSPLLTRLRVGAMEWSQPECGCDSSTGSSAGSRRPTGR